MQIYMAIYGVWISKEDKRDTNTRMGGRMTRIEYKHNTNTRMGTNDTNGRNQTRHKCTNESE